MKICISISLENLGKSGISYRATVGLATSPFLSGTYTLCLPMGPTVALALICIACLASWASLPAHPRHRGSWQSQAGVGWVGMGEAQIR